MSLALVFLRSTSQSSFRLDRDGPVLLDSHTAAQQRRVRAARAHTEQRRL